MSPALSLLEEFQALSRAMLQAAEDQSWELLAQLAGERDARQALLPESLEAHLPPEEIDPAFRLVHACLALDEQTHALADERKKLIGMLVTDH